MSNTPEAEWHRDDNESSILLYTLKQDGWRRGEPLMVNDLTIRIENANGSQNDLRVVAADILKALKSDDCHQEEPVTIPEEHPDLNLAAWMDIRRDQLGPWADYLIREVGNLEKEIARLRSPMKVKCKHCDDGFLGCEY